MIPFIDLQPQHAGIEEEIASSIRSVVKDGLFILGPAVSRFEEEMARYHGVRHAVGVASGTDALYLSLVAAGIGEGDEVITTPFTFVATAEVIATAGAVPVFADIDEATWNIDPGDVEKRITPKTKGLIPVHLYGLPADMGALGEIAAARDLRVIEDCAQSTGAKIGDGLTGSFGTASAFSFFPTKNLGSFGDGGMILTDDDEVAEKARMLRGHGSRERDLYVMHGYNSRLDSIQAAVLSVKLPHLERWNGMRRENADLYRAELDGIEGLTLPVEPAGNTHVYNQFTVLLERRDELAAFLREKGIGSMVYYSRSLHLQPVFADLAYRPGDFPVAEKIQERVLSLPVYPGLLKASLRETAAAVRSFFSR